MYFWEFPSYADRVKTAKQFMIDVASATNPGHTFSNVMPIGAYTHVIAAILEWQDAKGAFTLINGNTITCIPYEQIRSITLVLDPTQ